MSTKHPLVWAVLPLLSCVLAGCEATVEQEQAQFSGEGFNTVEKSGVEASVTAPARNVHDAILRISKDANPKLNLDIYDGITGDAELEWSDGQKISIRYVQDSANLTRIYAGKSDNMKPDVITQLLERIVQESQSSQRGPRP